MKRVLVANEKHGTGYFDASTDAQLSRSALHLLTRRWNTEYWYPDPEAFAPKPTELLTDEQVEALPTDRLRDAARQDQKYAREAQRYYESYKAWYAEAKDVVENQVTKVSRHKMRNGRVRVSIPAYELLRQRTDHEYEGVTLESVSSP